MKIYEKPSVDVRTFDVEDVMYESGMFDLNEKEGFNAIVGNDEHDYAGVVFQW